MKVFAVLSVYILVCKLERCLCAQCNNAGYGETNPKGKDDTADSTTAMGYLMLANQYKINCDCGVVYGWEIYVRNVVGTRTVDLQIWRATGTGDNYELVGENTITVTTINKDEIWTPIDPSSRITVKLNDRIGWWTSGTDMITYKGGNNEDDDNWQLTSGDSSTGDTLDWSGATVRNERSYAIGAWVSSNTSPTFSNLADTITIYNDHGSGVSLYTITVSDVDTYDVSTLSTVMYSSNTQFSFDSSTMIIKTATITSLGSSEVLRFRVTDQCGNTAVSTYTVTILNRPPVINNLPDSASIREDVTAKTLLHTINVTATISTLLSCSLASSVPASYQFVVEAIPGSTAYGIYSSADPGFNYTAVSSYSFDVDCTDTADTDTGTFTVNLIQNTPPVIVNLQNATSLTSTSTVGTNAFTVIASDAEGDSLSFTMTCDKAACPFQIFSSGVIELTDLLTNYDDVAYDVFITVSDGRNTDGPKTLTIDISDINYPVIFTNLPSSRSVVENTVLGTSVFQASIRDYDTGQTRTYSMTSSPSSGSVYLSIDYSTGLISTAGTVLDYEVFGLPTAFTLSVSVNDGYTSDTQDLTVDILDQNEAPYFNPTAYSLTANEGGFGDSVGTPAFIVVDQDAGDTSTFSMDCDASSGYFYMNSTSGAVTFQTTYDYDAGTLPTSVTCNVTTTDSGYLTGTAILSITIENINDNTPYFFPTSYAFYTSPYTGSVGALLGSTTATDGDLGIYGNLSYRLDQASLGEDYFIVDTSGAISINSNVNYSTSYVFKVIAEDSGGSEATASVTVVVTDTTTTPATTTTNSYKKFLDNPYNWAWLVPCVIILTITLAMSCWLFCTCHGEQGCSKVMARLRSQCKSRKKLKFPRRGKRGSLGYQDQFNRDRGDRNIARPGETDMQQSVRAHPKPKEMQAWRLHREP